MARQIGKTSALAMNLTGILKSIILVAVSLLIWSTPITLTQVVGYIIALGGMFYYSLPPEGLAPHTKALSAWLSSASASDLVRTGGAYMRVGSDMLHMNVVPSTPTDSDGNGPPDAPRHGSGESGTGDGTVTEGEKVKVETPGGKLDGRQD